jgi:hypothetical protein
MHHLQGEFLAALLILVAQFVDLGLDREDRVLGSWLTLRAL